MRFATHIKLLLASLLLINTNWAHAEFDETLIKNDISSIPAQYQKDVEKAILTWQSLKKAESAFYKELGYEVNGDHRPYALSMIDSPLAHFIYPWSLNNPFPFSTTHDTPYFTHYKPLKKMEDIGEITGNVDAVFVDGLDYEQFQSTKNPIHVHLKKEVGETTLILKAEGNADWDITWDEGVNIQKIIIPSTFPHFRIKTQTPNVAIVKSRYKINHENEDHQISFAKELSVTRNFYQTYANNIIEATGITPRSIWFGKKINNITVDGSNNTKTASFAKPLPLTYQKPKHPNYDKTAKAHIRVTDGYEYHEDFFKVIDDRTKGRWYWEVEYALTKPNGLRASYQVGAGHYGANFPTKLGNIVKDKDVMQFALDLDESYLYIGLNWYWIVGNPNQKGSGVRLAPNMAHIPELFINPDIEQRVFQPFAVLNFGAKPYKYRMPQNYLPYDSRFSDDRQKDINNTRPYKLQKTDLELAQFPEQIYQRTSPQLKAAWQNFQKAIVDYRQTACALTYAYKANSAVKPKNLDTQCVWLIKGYFGESMYFPIKELKNK